MLLNTCEACQKPETGCDCLGPRSMACDFCGTEFQIDGNFYESKAYKLFESGPEDCGQSSAVLSCVRCETIRMATVRWLGWIPFLFRGGKS